MLAGRHPSPAHHYASQARAPRLAVLLLALPSLAACTTVIVPPPAPSEPVTVFLLDHGRHASLVLPLEPAGAVRYSYGDWNYYVLGRTDFATGLRALFLPTRAALGRKRLHGTVDRDAIRRQLRVEILDALEIRVDAGAARRLARELGTVFESRRSTLHYSATYGVEFVRHPEPYSIAHNSNLVVAHWLEALGCRIRGRPVLSDWRIAH